MRGAWLFALALLSCAGSKPQPWLAGRRAALPPVQVTSLAVDFPVRERGTLEFSLELPPDAPPAATVTWELFLDGVRFAAGLEGQLTQTERRVTLKAPLVLRHLEWREGESTLDVGLKGEVDVGIPGETLGFKERREVNVRGRPVWTAPE